MTRAEIDRIYPTVHVKDQFLGNVFEGTFLDSDKISHRIYIVSTPGSQLPVRSGVFCLLIEVVY